jgi:lipopolysaccharide/colanic/teichoic acid biosynthesis glycosyltransferase
MQRYRRSDVKNRFVPFVHGNLRTGIGLALVVLSPFVAARLLEAPAPGPGVILSFVILGWLSAVYLTDKYRHKYPQRYYPYLAAAHLKSAVVMVVAVLLIRVVAGPTRAPWDVLLLSLLIFVVSDAVISMLRRRVAPKAPRQLGATPAMPPGTSRDGTAERIAEVEVIDTPAALAQLAPQLPRHLAEFVRSHLPEQRGSVSKAVVLDDMPQDGSAAAADSAGLLVGTTPLNHVRRLNLFLDYCTRRLAMGGYIVLTYTPLEDVTAALRRRFPGFLYWPAFILHFTWYRAMPKIPWLDKLYFSSTLAWIDKLLLRATKRRNRVLSKAEVWGRLAFYGMEVVAEQPGNGGSHLIARRVSPPVANRKPSYYAIVALEKVSLDGEIIRLHKVRSMYPFSEFLQKAIFQSHGLSATGKFKNDFRITEYGKLFRRHWIDELPGVFDWLRGDIKLVGMRATSPHFLSLYPREFYDLYIQIKPGLIPPIFDESTGGFEKIVEVEQDYLRRYIQAPLRTDVQYLWYTFRDIFLRKVRSH